MRTAVSVIELGNGGARGAVVFGDDSARVYALDASSGEPLWELRLDRHPDARITGAPVFYHERVYVPVSSYVNSGYGRIVGQPGNVLLAFGVDDP